MQPLIKAWCKSLYNFYYCRCVPLSSGDVRGVKAFIISTIVDKLKDKNGKEVV